MNRHGLPLQLKEGLVLWYPSYPGTGTTVYDASGNGNNGTLVNTPMKVRRQGREGFGFNGSNQRITLSASASLNFTESSSFSVHATVIHTSTTGTQFIFGKQQGGANEFFINLYSATGVPGFGVGKQSVVQNDASAGITMSSGKCYSIVGTYDGTTARIYVDGVLKGSVARTFSASTQSLANPTIASSYVPGSYFNGGHYNHLVWNRALSATEIQLLHKAFFIP